MKEYTKSIEEYKTNDKILEENPDVKYQKIDCFGGILYRLQK